jgi:hypothetical protein
MEKAFQGKRILTTGDLGFTVSAIARCLAGIAELTLVNFLIPEYGGCLTNIRGIEDKGHVNIYEVRDPNSMRYLVKGADYVFNMAGQTSPWIQCMILSLKTFRILARGRKPGNSYASRRRFDLEEVGIAKLCQISIPAYRRFAPILEGPNRVSSYNVTQSISR